MIFNKFYRFTLGLRCLRKFPKEIRVVELDGLEFHYALRGPMEGKAVVLLHGNEGSHKSMETQARFLALHGYRVYSMESRGQGSNAPVAEYHYSDMAEDCYKFIKALGLEKPAVYGWSDGGILALMLEMSHPGTCGLIALSGANLSPDCGEDFESFKEFVLSNPTPLRLMMLSEPDIAPEELHAITCPALVTAGSKDLISEEHTRLIADSIPGSRLVIVPNADHGDYIKYDPRMNTLLLDFFHSLPHGVLVFVCLGFMKFTPQTRLRNSVGKTKIRNMCWTELNRKRFTQSSGCFAKANYKKTAMTSKTNDKERAITI